MLPRVILHNTVTIDGRTTGFEADLGLYYGLAGRFNYDAHMAGSNTITASPEPTPPETAADLTPPAVDPADRRPLLVVPDSGAHVRNWHVLRAAGYWRGLVALVSTATPPAYLRYLAERHVDTIICGDDRVDLRGALVALNERYGVETVLLDSGGILNGAMLQAGLVSEVSVLIAPMLLGGTQPSSIFRAPDEGCQRIPIDARLVGFERMPNDYVWLHYALNRD